VCVCVCLPGAQVRASKQAPARTALLFVLEEEEEDY
jgi:hypothetical protein